MKDSIIVKYCKIQSDSIFSAIILLILIGAFSSIAAQDRFSINTSLTAVGGTLSDGTHNNSYFLYGGLRYQAQDYYLSLSLPLVFNSSGSFTKVGGMYFPNGNDDGNNIGGGMHGSGTQGSMMNGGLGMSVVLIHLGGCW